MSAPIAFADAAFDAKVRRLHDTIAAMPSVAVAFSGGVDSTLVLKVCHEQLGERAVAFLGLSPSLPPGELDDARKLCDEIGARLEIVQPQELESDGYKQNAPNRCYFCKTALYDIIWPRASELGLATVVDGLNLDDTHDYRPGRAAADEHEVRHPLVEAQFTKDDVRRLARALGLRNWDKPALACLSSRVAYGIAIDQALLEKLARAETALLDLGFRAFRVRHHGEIARIEVREVDLPRALEKRGEISRALKALGYQFVALDLDGYRSGSMNAMLSLEGIAQNRK